MLQNSDRNAIFMEMHRAIDEAVSSMVSTLEKSDIIYPPNEELTHAEMSALAALHFSTEARSGLRKIMAEAASSPLFHLFCLMDGVADPIDHPTEWTGLSLSAGEDDESMLHDDFFSSYWDYVESHEN